MVMTMIGIGLTAGAAFLWQLANLRGSRMRGRRRAAENEKVSEKRRGDVRTLSGPEKRLHIQAKELLAVGKIAQGARILEQLSMQREAIQALEDANLIHEAAKILTRMQKHNRAGVIYARHGMWVDAAKAFKVANMPLEVAKCAREAGSWSMAAEHFELAGRVEDAAEMHEKSGNYLQAARLNFQTGDLPVAMKLLDTLAKKSGDTTRIPFTTDEIHAVVAHIGGGRLEAGLIEIVFQHGRINDAVSALINNRHVAEATDLYRRSASDIGPQLIAAVDYQDGSAAILAQVFLAAERHDYAGQVYEHAGDFAQAGDSFEVARDFERAIYCYERAGLDHKAQPLKSRVREAPRPSPAGVRRSEFALSNLPESKIAFPGEGEPTAILSASTPGQSAFADRNPDDRESGDFAALPPSPLPEPPALRAAKPIALKESRPPKPSFKMVEDDAEPPVVDEAPLPFAASASVPARTPNHSLPSDADATALAPDCAAFHRAKFLSDLDVDQKNALWNIGHTKTYAEQSAILTYDDEPEGVYVIIRGSVSCFRSVNGKEVYVDQMGEAESFGELWLLADQPSAVRFVAAKESQLRIIGRTEFNRLMDQDGTLARKVYKRFTLRLLKRLLKPQNQAKNQVAS